MASSKTLEVGRNDFYRVRFLPGSQTLIGNSPEGQGIMENRDNEAKSVILCAWCLAGWTKS